jgi:hypothetical protein
MFVDSQLMFSDAQALTTTAVSTNIIDLSTDRNIGKGEPMAIVLTFGVNSGGTSPTLQVVLQTDNDVAFGSLTTIASSAVVLDAVAGDSIVLPIGYTNERYLRLSYVTGGTTPTATVDAYLQPMSMIDGKDDLPNGYTIV